MLIPKDQIFAVYSFTLSSGSSHPRVGNCHLISYSHTRMSCEGVYRGRQLVFLGLVKVGKESLGKGNPLGEIVKF